MAGDSIDSLIDKIPVPFCNGFGCVVYKLILESGANNDSDCSISCRAHMLHFLSWVGKNGYVLEGVENVEMINPSCSAYAYYQALRKEGVNLKKNGASTVLMKYDQTEH